MSDPAMSAHISASQEAAYTVDGRLVPREQFYALACDPRRSVVVEACAGAGKTWMLVSRILRALLDGAQPQEVLAITFTRKAAGEMRQRLHEWLHDFASCSEVERIEALCQRGMGRAEAQAAAPQLQRLQHQLLACGRAVEIRTFHAWFSQLLRAAPLEFLQAQAIAPELQLLEDEDELLPDLWRRFHARVLADEALLADYRSLSTERGRHQLDAWLKSAFDKRVEIRLAHQHGVLLSSMPDAGAIAPRFAGLEQALQAFAALCAPLQALARQLGQGKNKTQQTAAVALETALSALTDPGDIDALQHCHQAVREALFTKTGGSRKNLGDSLELQAMLDELDLLARAIAQQQAAVAHRKMAGLALQLIDAFEQLKLERGLVDMNDLERGALALLGDAELSGWVQQRLDAQLRHLLIDEFQDTSPLQWHALHDWLAAYAGAGGGKSGQQAPAVFIVGDPKQSIYRFRRAEPRVFAAARDFVRDALDGVVLECDHTRRNAPAVLDAVNAVFDAALRAEQYSGFRRHTTEAGAAQALDGLFKLRDGGKAGLDAPEAGDAEPESAPPEHDPLHWRPSLLQARHELELHRRAAEAERVTLAIEELLRQGLQPGEIFVLARKREPLRVLAQTLKARGIAHAAPEEQALLDAPDVRDLLALLDVLASNGHKLSLAHALRSPLFGAEEADLLWLAAQSRLLIEPAEQAPAAAADTADEAPAAPERAARRSWWQTLMQADEAALSPALQRARQLLGDWSAQLGQRTPHELLDAIVHQGDLLARIAAVAPPSERRSRLQAVDALLQLALDLDGGRYASVYGFVRSLKKGALKLSLPSEADAVQLLTVHGAKGLEARVVFMLDCEAGPARAETSTLALDWPVDASWPRTVAFIASESKAPPALQPLLDFEREQREREELNALYVAMTRARSRLVLSRTPALRKTAQASWWSRLEQGATGWRPEADAAAPHDAEAPARLLELPLLPARTRPQPDVASPEQPTTAAPASQDLLTRSAELDDSAALGEAMHRVLEWISGPLGQAQSLTQLCGAAAQMYGLDGKRSERLLAATQAIMDSPDCAAMFDATRLQWAGNEVPLALDGQDMRVDRLVQQREADGSLCWWVLDYKLHPAPQRDAAYRAQLRRYQQALRRLQPGEAVRTAFITGQGRLIEVSEND
ncbi:UvrD-helicase domain-containing protein [Paucibacter sp. APW11]|uniref:DNA 3'-5' helicase n=1 Tax=Roseateles aquae TaxID=3077235 RepID=A0ABU3P5X6_9BURK|nr:UvrD-helicase domain-containing protein [Paucibacter sp. APW11]MDT8997979.1 UvrD-helicase domain-containing protein [Paucibacter sp. APW11]